MNEPAWRFEHAVECEAPRGFAWKYWTNPENWEDPPARFEFYVPLAAGTRLTTILPGQRLESVIRDVEQGSSALIEMEVEGANVGFRWRFKKLGAERTKITQTICPYGKGAEGLIGPAKMLEQSVPEGMKRIARKIEEAWLGSHRGNG